MSNQRRQRGTEGPESIHALLAFCKRGEGKVAKSRSVWFVANIGVRILPAKNSQLSDKLNGVGEIAIGVPILLAKNRLR